MVDFYSEMTPIEKIIIDVPIVSSDYWESLSEDDQVSLIDEKIKKLIEKE